MVWYLRQGEIYTSSDGSDVIMAQFRLMSEDQLDLELPSVEDSVLSYPQRYTFTGPPSWFNP